MTEIYSIKFIEGLKDEEVLYDGIVPAPPQVYRETEKAVMAYLKRVISPQPIKERELPTDRLIEASPNCIITMRSIIMSSDLFELEESFGPFCIVHRKQIFSEPVYICTVEVGVTVNRVRVYVPVINPDMYFFTVQSTY